MRVVIEKSLARGKVSAPPSKSMAHRLLIAAAYADGESLVRGISSCEDVLATIDCLRALGAKIEYDGDSARVRGFNFKNSAPNVPLPCRESGSTLRFLIPTALLSGNECIFSGAKRLIERPHGVYEDLCRERGFVFFSDGEKITVRGRLSAGEYYMRADVSSQFITGMLYALAALDGCSVIHLTTAVESRSYIDLTISALNTFGVKCGFADEKTLYVEGGGYEPREACVEGDYSGTAFIESFNLFGGEVSVSGLSDVSLQGDRVYREYFKKLDSGFATLDIENCPDLGPILFTVAAAKHGARFTGTKRLKIKESDRAAVMAEELAEFGARLELSDNEVTVHKTELHPPTEPLSGHNDHRVVMSLAVLSSIYGGEILGFEAIKKSYPDFLRDIASLGIKVKIYET